MKMYVQIDKLEHGKEIPGHLGRWCRGCQRIHGRFFLCREYPRETLAEIKRQERDWLRNSASYFLLFVFALLLVFTALQ